VVERAVLERPPAGSRDAGLTLTTGNGTQFTSTLFLKSLARLGITIAARRITTLKETATSSAFIAA